MRGKLEKCAASNQFDPNRQSKSMQIDIWKSFWKQSKILKLRKWNIRFHECKQVNTRAEAWRLILFKSSWLQKKIFGVNTDGLLD